jgi:hypothetical protein
MIPITPNTRLTFFSNECVKKLFSPTFVFFCVAIFFSSLSRANAIFLCYSLYVLTGDVKHSASGCRYSHKACQIFFPFSRRKFCRKSKKNVENFAENLKKRRKICRKSKKMSKILQENLKYVEKIKFQRYGGKWRFCLINRNQSATKSYFAQIWED